MSTRWILKAVAALAVLVVCASACSNDAATNDDADRAAGTAEATPERSSVPAIEPTSVPAIEPTPVVTAVETAQPAPLGAPEPVSSLREVDFENGFTYETLLEFGDETATVIDGYFENGEFGDEEFYWFGVSQVALGDLDGDGIEEAVLQATWNGGGTGYFDDVRVYRLVDGRVERAGIAGFGDRAHGGVHSVRIVDNTVRVWTFTNGEGACCPTQIAEETLVLGEHALVRGMGTDSIGWFSLNDPRTADELKFLAGTSSSLMSAYPGENQGSVRFEANAGQRLELTTIFGQAPTSVFVEDLTNGERLEGSLVRLPTNGFYELAFEFADGRSEGSMIEIAIDPNERSDERPVNWHVGIDQQLLDEEPFVYTSVLWPVFDADQPGTAAANAELADYVTGLDDWWVADVLEYENPLDDSVYDVNFEVTLMTADLVSVNFRYYDYVCCRPYPNYGQHGAVVDLAAGRLIPVDDVLDLSRIDEINELWYAELEREDLLPPEVAEGEQRAQFDSISLTADGVQFGTDRNSLGGGWPGTSTLVSYEALGDLVNRDLVGRAQR